jgi:hypothetical protein
MTTFTKDKTYITKDYLANMDKIIRKNCSKYDGLNILAKEFVPSKNDNITKIINANVIETFFDGTNVVIENIKISTDENAFFDQLEYEFVQQNVWLFE